VIGIDGRISLDDVQRFAMKVARAVEPGRVGKVHDVDDQRVSVPVAAGIAQPPVDGALGMLAAVRVDVARCVHVLVQERDRLGKLNDLERERHVRDARHAGQVAVCLGVERCAVRVVPLALLQRLGAIGERIADHDAETGRNAFAG